MEIWYQIILPLIFQVYFLVELIEYEISKKVKLTKDIYSLLSDKEEMAIIFKNSFREMQCKLLHSPINIQSSGSTCCLLLISHNCLYSANVGDSRAITLNLLENALQPFSILTTDHKPTELAERKRILFNNGRIEPLRGKSLIRFIWKTTRTSESVDSKCASSWARNDKIIWRYNS